MYDKKFCEDLIEHMSRGKSFEGFVCFLYEKYGIRPATSTLYSWKKNYPEFKEAYEVGYSLSLDFFEKHLIFCMTGITPEEYKKKNSKGLNLTAIIFALKTRFHGIYGEYLKVEGVKDGNPININYQENLKKLSVSELKKLKAITKKCLKQ